MIAVHIFISLAFMVVGCVKLLQPNPLQDQFNEYGMPGVLVNHFNAKQAFRALFFNTSID